MTFWVRFSFEVVCSPERHFLLVLSTGCCSALNLPVNIGNILFTKTSIWCIMIPTLKEHTMKITIKYINSTHTLKKYKASYFNGYELSIPFKIPVKPF